MEVVVNKGEEKEKILLAWVAKSQPFNPREMKAQPVLMVMIALVALVLVFAQEWMLLVLMVAGGFYYYAIRRTEPMSVEFSITNKGVNAFGRMYMWWEMTSWWWEERWDTKVLALDLAAAGMMGRIYIPIEKLKPDDVEKLMNKYLIMQKPKETWVDKMVMWVKEKFPLENKT
jgi:hypothetical protein